MKYEKGLDLFEQVVHEIAQNNGRDLFAASLRRLHLSTDWKDCCPLRF